MTDLDRPGDEYPPRRPGPAKTLLGALIVILVGFAIAIWPQILTVMGIHVAPPGAGGQGEGVFLGADVAEARLHSLTVC